MPITMRSIEYPIPGGKETNRWNHNQVQLYIPSKTRTLEEGNDPPERDGAAAGVLAEGELEEEEGKASEGQVGEVGDEEGAWTLER